jgi:quinoprotein glucose dehydrogenase
MRLTFRSAAVGCAAVVLVLNLGPRSIAGQSAPDDRPALSNLPVMPVEVYLPSPPGVKVETILDGLEVVWGLQFAPDRRLFLTEKPGRIRIVGADGRLDATPWATIADVNAQTREQGLFGVALHPRFPAEPWVYVMYTARKGEQIVNRVSRLREVDGRGTGE